MNIIYISQYVGSFAENKDVAKFIREKRIAPLLEKNKEVILDFENVESATQSFIHAMISELIRTLGEDFFDKIVFKNCNEIVKKVISLVVDYMQASE
jgi:STAS-like domain of unknown function (DUF4325)